MRPKLFLDTNIMLDFLGERIPFYTSIAKIMTLADCHEVEVCVSALSYANVNYFLTKYETSKIAKEKLKKFSMLSEIISVTAKTIELGLNSKFEDFEDSLQYFCAIDGDADIILSRNQKDFKESKIPVMTAEEYLTGINKK